MASRSITVTVQLEWEEAEPDGAPCAVCGEAAYLAPSWRPLVTVLIGRSRGNHFGPLICGSCRWMLDGAGGE